MWGSGAPVARIGAMLVGAMVLMTVQGKNGPPSLGEAAAQLGVAVEDIDAGFGVVPIDPGRGLYSVQVPAERLPARSGADEPYRGPFSNPRIEPFGPVQTEPKSPSSSAEPPHPDDRTKR